MPDRRPAAVFQTAVVATARQITVLALASDDQRSGLAFARPSLVSAQRRKLELAACAHRAGVTIALPGAAYNDKQQTQRREQDRRASRRRLPGLRRPLAGTPQADRHPSTSLILASAVGGVSGFRMWSVLSTAGEN